MTTIMPAPPMEGEVIDLRTEAHTTEPAPPAKQKPGARRIVGAVFVGAGCIVAVFLLFEFFVTTLVYDRSQTLLLQDLRSLTASQEATSVSWAPAEGQPVGVLSIPRIGLSTVVVEGTTSTMTEKGPGHLRGTPLPGRQGNSVILGRRTTYGAPFSRLDELRPGDSIDVSTGVGQFSYLIAAVAVIRPGDPDVIGPSNDSRLTLITSSPRYLASGRYVVTAVLRGLPAKQPTAPTVAVAPSELGMVGEAGALGGLVLWSELAIVSVIAAIWLKRRVSARVAWLLAAPLVLALVWGAFAAADRFFPPTL